MYISCIKHVTSLYLWCVLVVLSEQTTWMTSTRLAGAEGLEVTNRRPQNMVFFLTEEKRPPGVFHCFVSPIIWEFICLYIYVYIIYIYILYINIVCLFMPEFGKKVESGCKILDRMLNNSWNILKPALLISKQLSGISNRCPSWFSTMVLFACLISKSKMRDTSY